MKFRDKYIENNLKISPDTNLKEEVLRKMNNEQEKSKRVSRYRLVAVIACIAIVVSCIGIRATRNNLDVETSLNDITKVEDYSEIYDTVSNLIIRERAKETLQRAVFGYADRTMKSAAPTDGSLYDSAPAPNMEYNSSVAKRSKTEANLTNTDGDVTEFSGTNLQVADVDEADIVKTDGKYIYTITNSVLRVINTKGEKPYVVSKTELDRYGVVGNKNMVYNDCDMYILGDKIAIIREGYSGIVEYGEIYSGRQLSTEILVFDLDQNGTPKMINQIGQSGSLLSTRRVGDIIYLVTNENVNRRYNYYYGDNDEEKKLNKKDATTFVPCVYNNGEKNAISCENIYVEKDVKEPEYLVISTLNIEDPKEFCETKTILGSGTELYSSTDNIYVALNDYEKSQTKFTRISLDGESIEIKARGKVKGELLNQFSMDEYNGYFRVVTTRDDKRKSENALYVLDQDLNTVGSIEGLAKDERVYSVRFDGDIGYFVTFRETDPLFTVDLSDVKEPKILSALKIPGFSEYLHPYSKDLLFGFGMEADNRGWEEALKLSMFDVSDKENVTEKDKFVLSEKYYDSEALYNHKAMFVAPEKNLIGFPSENEYIIFEYTKKNGFKEKANVKIMPKKEWNNYYYNLDMRGLYIGDKFYIVSSYGLKAFSMDDFKLIREMKFKDKDLGSEEW